MRINNKLNIILSSKIKKIKFIFLSFFSLGFFFNNYLIAQETFSIASEEFRNQKENLEINNFNKTNNNFEDIQKDFYLIGPGDILELTLLDVPDYSGEYTVLNDGSITLPLIGSIYLNNLSITKASNLIENKYRTELLRPELHLIVKFPRPILVSLIGEIERPGIYSLTENEQSIFAGDTQIKNSGLPTLIDAIQKAGGISQNANLEKVTVLRRIPGSKKEYKKTEVNLIKLLFEGDHYQNLYLFDGDIVKLSKASQMSEDTMKIAQANLSPNIISVRVIGEVNNPGQIKLDANTPLVQAVFSAGGPKAWKANKGNITLIRVNPNGSVTKKRYSLDLNADVSFKKNPPLKDKDIVYVPSTFFNKMTTGLSTVAEPISPIVTSITLFKLLN